MTQTTNGIYIENPQLIEGFIKTGEAYYRFDGNAFLGETASNQPIMKRARISEGHPSPALFLDISIWKEVGDSPAKPELPYEPWVCFFAFRYALGRMSTAVAIVVDYLINNAKHIPQRDKAQMISEINTAIMDGNAGWQMDVEQWERLRARLSVVYPVNTLFNGTVGRHLCYLWNGRYYTENMRSFIDEQYITSVDDPLVDAQNDHQ